MLNFSEEKVLLEHKNGLEIIPKVEKAVDEISAAGYKNVFYVGIGGTVLYANQMAVIAKQEGAALPIYVENAADFCLVGNPHFCKDSLVVIESITGDTPEVVAAVDKVKQAGARVLGYVENTASPLAKKSDYLISTTGGGYYFWYTVTLRLLKNASQFDRYDAFMKSLSAMPKAMVQVQKDVDEQAQAYAQAYKDEPITYLIGSGNLEDWATCYGMCIMEEMQWMRTKTVSASNFFHGTLEVIERDIPVILIKGEDVTRPLMERVEKFVHTICAKVTTFDTAQFALEGIDPQFRGILSPIVMRTAFQRVSAHLEYERRHPLPIRRYYRKLDY